MGPEQVLLQGESVPRLRQPGGPSEGIQGRHTWKWGHLAFVLRGTGVHLGPGTHCWDSHGGGVGCQKLASMVT